jgi:hypothetical protein
VFASIRRYYDREANSEIPPQRSTQRIRRLGDCTNASLNRNRVERRGPLRV